MTIETKFQVIITRTKEGNILFSNNSIFDSLLEATDFVLDAGTSEIGENESVDYKIHQRVVKKEESESDGS